MSGTRCTCGQGHETFGACMRAKGIRVGYCRTAGGMDATAEKRKNKELDLYKSARNQGVQPATTKTSDIHYALDQSSKHGEAFNAGGPPPGVSQYYE